MKSRTLLAEVLLVNLLLVTATGLVTALAAGAHGATPAREAVVFVLALVATLLGNALLLRRRFVPLDDFIRSLERIDLSAPEPRALSARGMPCADVRRLQAAVGRLLSRLERERREAGRAALAAQERERRRIAHDLHDEVNQALSAVALRLQATLEQAPGALRPELEQTKRLARQAMDELLSIARRLSPAALEDLGLVAALDTHVREVGERTGLETCLTVSGTPRPLTADEQLVIYRVAQESLSNVVRHARARRVALHLSFAERATLTITDDGRGLGPPRPGALGLSGMRERARLVGGELWVDSEPGIGTRVALRLA